MFCIIAYCCIDTKLRQEYAGERLDSVDNTHSKEVFFDKELKTYERSW